MYFVRNSYEYNRIPEPWDHLGILEHIEKIGRLCYRSDDKICEGSAARFIQTLKNNKHWAMLEHYIFNISIPEEIYDSIMNRALFNDENTDYTYCLKFVQITRWDEHRGISVDPDLKYIISGSATAFNNLWACSCVRWDSQHGIHQICQFLKSFIPELMVDPLKRTQSDDPDYWKDKFNPEIKFLSRDVIRGLPTRLRAMHDWMSVHLVVERSSTHDLVRHRPLVSYGQESTRYCNYGQKGLCFVIPCQFSENDKQILEDPDKVAYVLTHPDDVCYGISPVARRWAQMIQQEADSYLELLNEYNMTPQEAKSVIPHSLRAEINITTFKNEWHHIFDMRADRSAYPQIQEVMCPLLNDCITDDPEIFDDLRSKVNDWRDRNAKHAE